MITTELMSYIDFDINDKTNRYYNSEGKSVPRVTEILSEMIHSDALMIWSNVLGLRGKRYKEELERAATLGTQSHFAIECYLRDKIKSENNIPFLGFLLWEKVLNEKGIYLRPLFIEEKLICDWFGGTADTVFDINGRIFLVDYKTSNHVTYKYFLQLAAYKYMLALRNIKIDGVIVLQLDKRAPGFNEYLLDFSIPDHFNFMSQCEQAFFSLVFAYYNIKRVETGFKKIF